MPLSIASQGGISIDTSGDTISFTLLQGSAEVRARGFSVSSAVCYMQLNQVPASASVGTGKRAIAEGDVFVVTGPIGILGFKTDSGTCVIEVIGNPRMPPNLDTVAVN